MSPNAERYPMYSGGVKLSNSKIIVAGNLVFCSGMDGSSPKTGKIATSDVSEQTTAALEIVKEALTEAGASMDNIVRMVVLLKDMKDISKFREAECKYYEKHAPLLIKEPPACRVAQFRQLLNPDALVDIDVTAVLSKTKPGWEMKKYPPPRATGYCSKASVVGNLVFCSGMDARDFETSKVLSNNIVDQVNAALDNLRRTLREAGTTMDNIVETTMLLTDLKNYAAMRETEAEYYQSHARRIVDDPPASTFISMDSLATPECLFEIQATAVLSQEMPGWKVTKYPEWCEGKRLTIPYFPAGLPHLSKAIKVGDFLIGGGCSARVAKSPDTIGTTIEEQMAVTLEVIQSVVEDAGSSLENVIQTFIMLKDIKDYPGMKKAELDFYRKHAPKLLDAPPVTTVFQPIALARPDYLIEMDSLSYISR